MLPSVKSLKELEKRYRLPRGTAQLLRRALEGDEDVLWQGDHKRYRQHYNPPTKFDRICDTLNEILGTHGVEAVRSPDVVNRYWGDSVALFLNTGDSYEPTLLYDIGKGRWLMTSLGDWVEGVERAGRYHLP
jgi:hypothetical protein